MNPFSERPVALVPLLALLMACGGGSSSPPPTSVPSPPPPFVTSAQVPDTQFKSCILKAAADNAWQSYSQVINLACVGDNYHGFPANLEGIELFANLQSLDIRRDFWVSIGYDRVVVDLTPLASLTQLTTLLLDGHLVEDLSPLAQVHSLRHLSLVGNIVKDLGPLEGLALETLDLTSNGSPYYGGFLVDVAPIASLTSLKYLSLGGNEISDISALGSLHELEVLFLNRNYLADFNALETLTNLRVLSLSTQFVDSISVIPEWMSKLTRLEELAVDQLKLVDVTSLQGIPSLRVLILSYNSSVDIAQLAGLPLTFLDLSSNKIENRQQLASLTSLEVLDINGTYSDLDYADFEFLRSLAKLRNLGLIRTGIASLEPLEAHPALQSVQLGGTPVASLSPLVGVDTLEYVSLKDNYFLPCADLADFRSQRPDLTVETGDYPCID